LLAKILEQLPYRDENTNELLNILPNIQIKLDSPEPWGLFFQDNATPQMEGLEELHNSIMFYLAIILFAVS
jgi:Cytochrome C oxidase subunit II, transmembrane domain